eukprot:jgi/Mesvir1/29464/Mv23039-RA.1
MDSRAGEGSTLGPFRGALAVDLQAACRMLGAAYSDSPPASLSSATSGPRGGAGDAGSSAAAPNPRNKTVPPKAAPLCLPPLLQQAQCSVCVSRLPPPGDPAHAEEHGVSSNSTPSDHRLGPVAGVAVIQAILSAHTENRGSMPRSGVVSLCCSLQATPESPASASMRGPMEASTHARMDRVDIVWDHWVRSVGIGADGVEVDGDDRVDGGNGVRAARPPARVTGGSRTQEGAPGAAEALMAGARAELEWLVGLPWSGGLEDALTCELDHFCRLALGVAPTALGCTLAEAAAVERCLDMLAGRGGGMAVHTIHRWGVEGRMQGGLQAGGQEEEGGSVGDEGEDDSGSYGSPSGDDSQEAVAIEEELGGQRSPLSKGEPSKPSMSRDVSSREEGAGNAGDNGRHPDAGDAGSRPPRYSSSAVGRAKMVSFSQDVADGSLGQAPPSPWDGTWEGDLQFSADVDPGYGAPASTSVAGAGGQRSGPRAQAAVSNAQLLSQLADDSFDVPAGDGVLHGKMPGKRRSKRKGSGRADGSGCVRGLRAGLSKKNASSNSGMGDAGRMGYKPRVKYPPNTAMGSRPSPDKNKSATKDASMTATIHPTPHRVSVPPPEGQRVSSSRPSVDEPGVARGWVYSDGQDDDADDSDDAQAWAPGHPSWPAWHTGHRRGAQGTVTVIVHRPSPRGDSHGPSPAPIRFTIDPVAAAEKEARVIPGGKAHHGVKGGSSSASGASHLDAFVGVVVAMASATRARGPIKGVFDMQGREKVSLADFFQGEHVVLLQAGESLDRNLFPFYEGTSSGSEGEGEGHEGGDGQRLDDGYAYGDGYDDGYGDHGLRGDATGGMTHRRADHTHHDYRHQYGHLVGDPRDDQGHQASRAQRGGGSRRRREERERAFLDRLSRPKPALVHSVVFVHLATSQPSSSRLPSSSLPSSAFASSTIVPPSSRGVPVSITSSVETLPQLLTRVERALESGMPVTRLFELKASGSKRGSQGQAAGGLVRGKPIKSVGDVRDGMHLVAYTLATQLDASRSRSIRRSLSLDEVDNHATGTMDRTTRMSMPVGGDSGRGGGKPSGPFRDVTANSMTGDCLSWAHDDTGRQGPKSNPQSSSRAEGGAVRRRRSHGTAAASGSNTSCHGQQDKDEASLAERDASFLARMSAPSPHHTSLTIRVFRGTDVARWGIPDQDALPASHTLDASLSYLSTGVPGVGQVAYRALPPTYPPSSNIPAPAVPRSRAQDLMQRQQGTIVRVPASVSSLPALYERIQRAVRPPLLNPVREICSAEGYPIDTPGDLENGQDVVFMCQGDPPFVPGTRRHARPRRSSVGHVPDKLQDRGWSSMGGGGSWADKPHGQEWGVARHGARLSSGSRSKVPLRPFSAGIAVRARAGGSGFATARSLDSCSFEQGVQMAKEAAEAASIVASQMFAGSLSLELTPPRSRRVQ